MTNTGVRLRVRHQHSQYWPILVRFVHCYSPFWGPRAISMIDDPWGASTCWSSTLAVFVDSDPFRGLLLTVLGSQSDFHGCRIPRCAYVLVVKTRSLGRFWPVSWTITQFWCLEVISTIDDLRGASTCRSSTLAVFFDSDPFRGLLVTVLGSPKRFL